MDWAKATNEELKRGAPDRPPEINLPHHFVLNLEVSFMKRCWQDGFEECPAMVSIPSPRAAFIIRMQLLGEIPRA